MNNWETLITFTWPHEAHMAMGFLESEGIRTMIRDEMTVQIQNFYSNAVGGVKVLVQREDYESGLALLKKGGYILEESDTKEEIRLADAGPSDAKSCCSVWRDIVIRARTLFRFVL